MSRAAPYGKTDATGLPEPHGLALRALALLVDELDRRATIDPGSAQRLSGDILSLLLQPSGRALLPYSTDAIARLLAHRSSEAVR
jgi:hypothetical protein